ncbi:MAG: C1 family peptidase, partial [Chitinophagales bacterium]
MRNLLFIFMAVCISAGTTYSQYGTGVIPDPVAAKKFPVKIPVSKGYGSDLPSSFSLKAHTPYAKNQGNYGTCTSWAVAYGTMTTAYAYQVGFTNRNLITGLSFDPYFVYNQVRGDASCQSGSSVENSLLLLMDVGAKKFYMPVIGCGTAITDEMKNNASSYRIADAYILYNTTDIMPNERAETALNKYFNTKPKPDIEAVKSALTLGSPVVFASYIPASFFAVNTSSWQATAEEKTNPAKSVLDNTGMHQLHAMTVVGYDDNKNGGSFEIMNSWGEAWGKDGFTWVTYTDWAMFTYQAFWIDLGMIGAVEALLKTGCMSGDCTNGYGVYAFDDGTRYEGNFTAGNYDKYGIYTWPTGEVYAGQWKNGMRHGEATRYLPTGEYGTCIYENDKLIS